MALPNGITGVENGAFYCCSRLDNVVIPNGTTYIGVEAFLGCRNLINITLPNSIVYIDHEAFSDCTSLTDIIIPNNVTGFSYYTFRGCVNLRNITISSSVTYIGSHAFYCCEKLQNIYYRGTKKQWDSVRVDYPDGEFINATVHYNSSIPINVHTTNTNSIAANITDSLDSLLSKVTLCDTTIYGPTIDILGYDWQPLKFNAKAVLDLARLSKNITIDEDKKTVHVILGKKNVNGQASVVQTTKMCDASWSKQYNEIKDLYKTMTGFDMKGSSGGVNNWNRFEKMKAELNHLQCDFIIDADMSVLGYLDFDYQSGSLKLSEGGLIETASLGTQIPSGGVLYTALGLKGEEKGTIKATVSSSGKMEPYMSLTPSLTATAKLGTNIGAFKAEGGIDATLAVLLQTMDPNLKVAMSGNLFAYASIPALNMTLLDEKYPYLNCELYPEFKNNLSAASASLYSLRANTEMTDDILDVQPMDRSYLYDISLMSVTDENAIYTLDSVYPQNNAQLVQLSGDSMMLVWAGDDGTKSDINRSSLMYSIYKNGVWSEIHTINEDGTATGDFKVVTNGASIYI